MDLGKLKRKVHEAIVSGLAEEASKLGLTLGWIHQAVRPDGGGPWRDLEEASEGELERLLASVQPMELTGPLATFVARAIGESSALVAACLLLEALEEWEELFTPVFSALRKGTEGRYRSIVLLRKIHNRANAFVLG